MARNDWQARVKPSAAETLFVFLPEKKYECCLWDTNSQKSEIKTQKFLYSPANGDICASQQLDDSSK